MQKLKFTELDPAQKRLVFWLADEAATLTPTILAAVSHVGELWEAKAFFMHFPQGSEQYTQLANRLRLGDAPPESILDCIRHAAPAYATLGQRSESGFADLLPELGNASAGL